MIELQLKDGQVRHFKLKDEQTERALVVRFQRREVAPHKMLTINKNGGAGVEQYQVCDIKHMTIVDIPKPKLMSAFGDIFDDIFGGR